MAETKIVIRASDRTKAAFKSVQASMAKVTRSVMSFKGAIGVAIGVGGVGALVKSSLDAVDALAKKSDQLGVTTKSLAGLHHATQLYTSAGVGALDEALVKATKRLGEFNATGGGAAAQWLKKLQLDTQQLAALSPDQLFLKYAEAIRGLNDRGQQMAAMSALMGDESRQLIGLIDAGSEAINEATKRAEAYGLALNRVDAAKIEAANDALFEAGQAVKGVATTLTVQLAPYIKVVAQRFADAAAESGGFKGVVLRAIEGAAMAVGYLGNLIKGLEFAWAAAKFAAAKAFEYIIKVQLNAIGKLVAALSYLPGKVSERFANIKKSIDANITAAEQRSAELKQRMDEIAAEGLPADRIRQFFAEVRAEADATAAKVAATAAKASGIDGAGQVSPESTAEVDKQRQMLSTKLENLNTYLMSVQEREQQAYENRRMLVEQAFQDDLITAQTRQQLLEQLEAKHQKKLSQLEFQGLSIRQKFAVAFAKRDVKTALAAGAQMTAGMATQNKRMFQINKALALANAIVSLPDAVMQSFRNGGGYPWGLIPAGLMLATGLAQINAIRSATYGGGASAPSLTGAGGGGRTVNTVPATAGLPGSEQTSLPDKSEGGGSTVQIVFQGDVYGWDDYVQEKVIGGIKDALDRDVKVAIS